MFTGIITDIGKVLDTEEGDGRKRLFIKTSFDLPNIPMGASIACDGCCLTVVEKSDDSFAVDVSNETLSKTTIGKWLEGTNINLEQSLKLGDELGGHLVSGHVDGLAVLERIEPDGNSYRLTIKAPEELALFIASKGSVALNGISLTVNEVEDNSFGVNIIPHTWEATNISRLQPGDKINLEVDMLARYVARMLEKQTA